MEATALHIFFEFWEIIRFCSVQVIKYIIRVHSFLQKNGDVAVGLEQTWQKVGYWRGKTCNTCCIPPKMFSLTDEKNKHSGRFAVTTTCFLKKCHDDKKKRNLSVDISIIKTVIVWFQQMIILFSRAVSVSLQDHRLCWFTLNNF